MDATSQIISSLFEIFLALSVSLSILSALLSQVATQNGEKRNSFLLFMYASTGAMGILTGISLYLRITALLN